MTKCNVTGSETKEESKEGDVSGDPSAEILQRNAFVLVTVNCQKHWHQT